VSTSPELTSGSRWSSRASTSENTDRLREIVREYGWPGVSLVGEQGSDAAWLLAQHADRQLDFQREVLPLLERAVDAGEAKPAHVAYLTIASVPLKAGASGTAPRLVMFATEPLSRGPSRMPRTSMTGDVPSDWTRVPTTSLARCRRDALREDGRWTRRWK
jgi:hypothetical protein